MKGLARCALAVGFLALPLWAAACGEEGTGPGDGGDTVEGSYTLVEVNDKTTPVTVYTDTIEGESGNESVFEIRVTGGRLELSDGQYALSLQGEAWQDGEFVLAQDFADTGSYGVSGQTVTFDSDDPEIPGTITATLSGDVLTQTVQDPDYGTFTATFRKSTIRGAE